MKHVQVFESFETPVSYLIYTDDMRKLSRGIYTLSGNSEQEALDSLRVAVGQKPGDTSNKWGEPGEILSVEDLIEDLNGSDGTWLLYDCPIPNVPLGFDQLMPK
jgi:hypothetical protein